MSKILVATSVEKLCGAKMERLCVGCGPLLRASCNSDALSKIPDLAEVFRDPDVKVSGIVSQLSGTTLSAFPCSPTHSVPSSVAEKGATPPVDADELRTRLVSAAGNDPALIAAEVHTPHAKDVFRNILCGDRRFVGDGSPEHGDDEDEDGGGENDPMEDVVSIASSNDSAEVIMPSVHPPLIH
jgi:hypothetical protein